MRHQKARRPERLCRDLRWLLYASRSRQHLCCRVRQLAGQFLRAQTINERSAQSPGSLGRGFDRNRFDEIGGTEPPELSKLVASDFTSSRHALQGLGVNP